MRYNNVSLEVKVKNKTITEYPHNGQVFIEGRADSNFSVVITNHNPYRVEAVVSVDGLSVLDGKDAGPQSQGYLLNANETLAIPGWTLNDKQVAAFQFAGKGGSYAAQSTGSSRNTGVIGLLVYKERGHQYRNYTTLAYHGVPLTFAGQPLTGGYVPTTTSAINNVNMGMLSTMQISAGLNVNAMIGGAGPKGPQGVQGDAGPTGKKTWTSPGVSASETDMSYSPPSTPDMSATAMCFNAVSQTSDAFDIPRSYAAATPQVQNLGTGFGQCQGFETTSVSFDRGDMQAMLVLYYDDARGLKSRGIELARTKKARERVAPNAFPGLSGCKPPAGWQG